MQQLFAYMQLRTTNAHGKTNVALHIGPSTSQFGHSLCAFAMQILRNVVRYHLYTMNAKICASKLVSS